MGRDIQAIKISGEDRRNYRDKLRRSLDVFARMLRERLFDDNPSTVGQEIELNLVDERGMPSMRNDDVLKAIADPAHEEHESYLRWIGGVWDPKGFDLNRVNRDLHSGRARKP